jgi:hypothetical protein
MSSLRPLLGGLLWLVAALAIALGAAGLVTALEPPAAGDGGALTAPGDARVTEALDAIETRLANIEGKVEELGTQARGALASLAGQDLETVQAAIDAGDAILEELALQRAAVALALGEVPLVGTPEAAYQVSPAVLERYERLRTASRSIDDLDPAWARLTTGSLAASRLSQLLSAHDEAVLAAAERGRDADYDRAQDHLDDADAAIEAARDLRDVLANTVDVTVLDQWLDRNADYDAALRKLYRSLDGVGGRVTDDVREAVAAERAAKERLPGDSRGLIVIMADIGRGGMNGAITAIEEARGALDEALQPVPTPSVGTP